MVSVTFNSFIEDTAVFVAGAFLIVRGRVIEWLADDRVFGVAIGLLGASEVWLPRDRFPYAPHTLAISIAAQKGGAQTAAFACGTILLNAAMATRSFGETSLYTISAIVAALPVLFARRFRLPVVVLATAVGQCAAMALAWPKQPIEFLQVPANAFAFCLFALVFRDADVRSRADAIQRDAENARRLAVEAQLTVVRSRIQPHFLFNTLNTIAALCTIAPQRAASATIRLAKIMRRALDVDSRHFVTLRREMETVEEYVAIENERFMDKLRFDVAIVDPEDIVLPAFGVQVLVENAILHGVSRLKRPSKVRVESRACRNGWLISVSDEGPTTVAPSIVDGHGLSMLDSHLRSRYGVRSRIRLFRRRQSGVLATFFVPKQSP